LSYEQHAPVRRDDLLYTVIKLYTCVLFFSPSLSLTKIFWSTLWASPYFFCYVKVFIVV